VIESGFEGDWDTDGIAVGSVVIVGMVLRDGEDDGDDVG